MKIKMHSVYNHLSNHYPKDGEPYVDCYNDYDCLTGNIPPNSIALLIEPRSIQPRVYEWMERNYHKFRYVFTHDSKMLDMCDNAKLILWGGGLGGIEECPHVPKTKNISFVSSNKTMCQEHKWRLKLAKELKDNPLVDVMGTFDGGERVSAQQIYQDYRFSIAYENYIDYHWFTEKICNCFANKVIPIYLGTPIIDKWFNEDGIIMVQDNLGIKEAIKFMSQIDLEAVYNRKLDAIEDNYQRVQKYATFENWFFNEYGELLDDIHS